LLRPYQGICAPAQQKKRGLGAGGGLGSSETPKNGVSEEPKLHGKHADCTQGWGLSMITVVIDHISWHEAQQEHTDNHNLNGGGCHYQSGFRLVMSTVHLANDGSVAWKLDGWGPAACCTIIA